MFRHILLVPKPTEQAMEEAKKKLEGVREKIVNNEITFAEAAAASSDDKDTKQNGGVLRDPMTMDPRFDLNTMEDRELYFLVNSLKEKEVSPVALKTDYRDQKSYRIVTINKKIASHKIDFVDDYTKVKEHGFE